jgi:hypothetical protein
MSNMSTRFGDWVLPVSEKRCSTSAAWGTVDKRVITIAFKGCFFNQIYVGHNLIRRGLTLKLL